ncbi:MAG TPA: hypothetical protein DET40_16740 [Lentisphaeria bacterium]|nr:MAG: hypothetical protein A2X45_13005 [Lentisphaerae bacterium GWF2_50_93]HCE45188.1 hypothetical protein [Lentisphaeria bacterium]
MKHYFLKCELQDSERKKALFDELANLNARHVFGNSWFLQYKDSNASKLRNHFKYYIGSGDRLIVTEVTDWAGVNIDI